MSLPAELDRIPPAGSATEVVWLPTLRAAAAHAGCSMPTLREAMAATPPRVRSHPHVYRGRATRRINAAEFAEDLAQLRCAHPGCRRYGLGKSGGCDEHQTALRLTGVRRPPEVVAKVATALRGKPRPSARKYEDAYRVCAYEKCDNVRLLEGWKINSGAFRFCSYRCARLDQWATRKAGSEITCPECQRIGAPASRYVRPSHLANYTMTGGYCREHFGQSAHFRAQMRARSVRVEARWRASLGEYKDAAGLLDVQDLAAKTGLGRSRAREIAHALSAERWNEDGRRLLVRADEVDAWFKTFSSSNHNLFMAWRKSLEFNIDQRVRFGDLDKLLARGLELDEARVLMRGDAEARMARLWAAVSQHRSPGRPRGESRARRWRDRRGVLGTAVAVLYEDVLDHPRDWHGYPTTLPEIASLELDPWQLEDFETRGRNRINRAISRLPVDEP